MRDSVRRRVYGRDSVSTFRATSFIGLKRKKAITFLKEIETDNDFISYISNKSAEWEEAGGRFDVSLSSSLAKVMYVLCRAVSPRVIIETGVGGGRSSAYLLRALEKNQEGRLYSIDLPLDIAAENRRKRDGMIVHPEGAQPNGFAIGWLIPPNLKSRWTLIEGDSRTELPSLLSKLGVIDLFYHDSLHTYQHMMFEYQEVWPHLKERGLLLSDDVTTKFSDSGKIAFSDFCRAKAAPYVLIKNRLGLTQKPSP